MASPDQVGALVSQAPPAGGPPRDLRVRRGIATQAAVALGIFSSLIH
jgi:hypothetical protein